MYICCIEIKKKGMKSILEKFKKLPPKEMVEASKCENVEVYFLKKQITESYKKLKK